MSIFITCRHGGDRSGVRSLPLSIPICTEVGVVAGKMHSILAAAGQPLPRPLPPHNSSERGATPPSAMGKYRKPGRKRFPIWFPTLRHTLHFTILYATRGYRSKREKTNAKRLFQCKE